MKIYKNPALWLALFLVIVSHNIFAEVATPPVSPPPQVAASPTATASVAPPQAAASPAPSKASESSKIQSNSWEQADQWLIYGVIFFGS
ncbi:MAG: hypothetical protein IPI17_16160 [Nitrosomonas sp.]|jgi:hypothetical protein|nr:hypothetical protein [Nitrosomonas sp.]